MKYIKMFENFDRQEYYHEVEDMSQKQYPSDHVGAIEDIYADNDDDEDEETKDYEKFISELEEFTERELSEIKSYFNSENMIFKLSNVSIETYIPDQDDKIVSAENSCFKVYHISEDNLEMKIYKKKDEWYLIRIPTSAPRPRQQREFRSFECDQLGAIKYILKEKNF